MLNFDELMVDVTALSLLKLALSFKFLKVEVHM